MKKQILKRKLKRETRARERAEEILEEKSLELYKANLELANKIEELKNRTKLLDEYKRAVDRTNIVSKTDINGNIIYVNDEFCNTSMYSENELLGKKHNLIKHPDTPKEVFEDLWNHIKEKKIWRSVIKNRKKDGSEYYLDTTIVPILDKNNELIEFISISKDVSKFLKQEEIIKRQSIDTLTKLPNRQKLINDLKEIKNRVLAIIDIDSFKEINDFYGHEIGDRVLIELASKLSKLLNEDVNLYKLSSDEFAMLFLKNLTTDEVKSFLQQILVKIREENFYIEENEIHINLTIGVAKGDKKEILAKADIAKNRAKKTKRDILAYDKSLAYTKDEYQNNLTWIKKLKDAIVEDRVKVFFQPIVNNFETKKKYEVLIRVIDENGEVISPFFFLDIAKKSKIYPSLTKIVVDKSFETFQDKDIEFSINLSLDDILDVDTLEYIKEKVKVYPKPNNIIFEITESEGIENFKEVSSFIKDIKSFGCKIAIDDFGTGYSNFEYIIKMNIDYLKIDGSLIRDILINKDLQIMIETIASFAKRLNIKVVAEFVSSKEIAEYMKELGIEYSQGFYFGKPSEIL